jgi:hypothetical protein
VASVTQGEIQAAIRLFGSSRIASKFLGVSKSTVNNLAKGQKASRETNRTLENSLASLKKSDQQVIKDGGRMMKHLSPDQWNHLNKGKWFDRKTGTYKGKALDEQETIFQGFKKAVNKWKREGEKYPPKEMYKDIFGDSPPARKRKRGGASPRRPSKGSYAYKKAGFDF